MNVRPPKPYTIEFDIDREGVVTAKLKGIQGKACHEVMKFIDDMGLVTIDAPTEEFFQKEEEKLKLTLKVQS